MIHYIVARSLGLEARIGVGVMWFQKKAPRWKRVAVLLAPAITTLPPMGFCVWQLYRPETDRTLWTLLFLVSISVMSTCILDFKSVWGLMRKGDDGISTVSRDEMEKQLSI
ncbi:MAG: hypothetical protein H8D34_28415 [Chloroflexi bacterium]|nr:hypothetical protein [Chloroflexota bacterium]